MGFATQLLFHVACFELNKEMVELLLSAEDIDCNMMNKGNAPIHEVAKTGLVLGAAKSIWAALLTRDDIDGNLEGADGFAAIHTAAKFGGSAAEEFVSSGSVNVNVADSFGNFPLHIAVLHLQLDLAQILLLKNARVNCKDESGNTPLHLSLTRKHEVVLKLLLCRHDIDVNAQNNEGDTPLLIATRQMKSGKSYDEYA